ncbi:MAG TPA: FeoA family protein [Lacipirellulaceae bacterium]|nr:FeoA family protein [Lacipirellulaceae bacterium]
MRELVPLSALRPGQTAEITELVGPRGHIRRLQELGLRSGALLQMIRCGSPCILRVDGSTLCFRDDDSLRVTVRSRNTA